MGSPDPLQKMTSEHWTLTENEGHPQRAQVLDRQTQRVNQPEVEVLSESGGPRISLVWFCGERGTGFLVSLAI